MAAKEWATPPWIIAGEEPAVWYLRWIAYRAESGRKAMRDNPDLYPGRPTWGDGWE